MAQNIRLAHSQAFTDRPRILVAEAQPDKRQYLTQLLSEQCEIVTAADASAALTLARKRAPDLIVAHVTMRASRDFDLLRQCRRDAWGGIPVIMYSTTSDEDSSVNASEAGHNNDVITPFSERQLLALVQAHLRVIRMRRESIESLRWTEDRDSEARYRTFMAMTTSAVWRTGPDGDVNTDLYGWEELTGQTHDQYQGMGWLEAVHPDDRPWMLEICKTLCAMGHLLIRSLGSGERTVRSAMSATREFRYAIRTEVYANGSARLSTLMKESGWNKPCG
jgi:CheY-like chemotaxis protein